MEKLKQNFTFFVSGLIAVLLLAACSGGGGGGSTPAASTSSPVVSQGVVTAKGSVFVNGIEFSTTGATITIDDNPGIESDLKVGMTVKVKGVSDDTTKKGTATRIEARDALEGRIDSVDIPNNTITVMGQTVIIEDNITRLNDDDTVKIFSAAAFAVGNIVEVNGFADDNGGLRLRATRVAKKATGDFESKGFVVAPITATSFGLSRTQGGASFVTVSFAAPLTAPALNSFIEVRATGAPVVGVVTAIPTVNVGIHLEDKLGAAGEKVETEGIVISGTLASFVVNGQQVVTDASTIFEGGLSSDFAIGVKLEAEGPLNASGAIAATKISFRSSIKIEGDVTAVTATSATVLGKTIFGNQFTNGALPAVGNHVEIRATIDRNGNLLATRVVVLSASTKAFLQGPVTAADSAAGTLTILGSTLVSDSATQWRVSSTSTETAVTKAAFYAQLKTNISVVKVRWDNFTTTSAPVKEAEIEIGK